MVSDLLKGIEVGVSGVAGARPLQSVRILLVEDDPLVATTFVLTLKQAGAYVVSEREYTLAMSHFKYGNTRFDVLVCDYDLGPGGTGLDFIEEAREHYKHPMACILISGSLGRHTAYSRDIPLMEKPFHPAQLVGHIKQQLTHTTPDDTIT